MPSPAPMPPPTTLPDLRTCEQARLSRDARFDGRFFTAVTSTRIYCRPVCPAPAPKPQNIVYYPNAAAAEAAGFRPCLRCRPELSPGDGLWRRGDALVSRALKLIEAGALAEQPLGALADRLHVGERHLRRLFVDHVGAAPSQVHGTRRLLFAKQLLTETALPVTEIALASGFGSVRRFNDAFLAAYGLAPTALRKRDARAVADTLTLRLGYRPPYDLDAMLDFLDGRALPGVERVADGTYRRVVGSAGSPGWLQVGAWPGGEPALKLELHGVAPAALLDTVTRVRRMFDLDADPLAIADALSVDPTLRTLVARRPGLRLPSGWDGFEIAVRAILGQQVSVAAARTFAARIAERFGHRLPDAFADGLTHFFPTPDALADADLAAIGLTRTRAATVREVARALLDGRVDFDPQRTLEDFVARWVALPGIGPWTAQYMALRALGHPDAFPADDLVLKRVFGGTARAAEAQADAWRPWRAYAVIQAWRENTLAQRAAPSLPRTAKASR